MAIFKNFKFEYLVFYEENNMAGVKGLILLLSGKLIALRNLDLTSNNLTISHKIIKNI